MRESHADVGIWSKFVLAISPFTEAHIQNKALANIICHAEPAKAFVFSAPDDRYLAYSDPKAQDIHPNIRISTPYSVFSVVSLSNCRVVFKRNGLPTV